MAYNGTAKETEPNTWLHLNGTADQILDRYCVSELVRGWPLYVDYSEWKNYRACFADDAWVLTCTHNTHTHYLSRLTKKKKNSVQWRLPAH